MATFIISSTTTGYTAGTSYSNYLLGVGDYITSFTHGLQTWGSTVGNTYTIDGYILADNAYAAVYLTGTLSVPWRSQVHIGLNGVLSGGTGIWVEDDPVSIFNQGFISGDNNDGIRLEDATADYNRIVNSGTITSVLDAIEVEGDATDLENSGTLIAYFNAIDLAGSDNRVTNSGSMNADYTAIYIQAGDNTITNSGSITSNESIGIYVAGNNNTITNTEHGTIRTGPSGSGEGVFFDNGVSNTLINDGAIYSGGIGVAFNSSSIGVAGNALTNRGTITSDNNYAVFLSGNGNKITNSGLLESILREAILFFGSDNLIVNSGEIIADDAGIYLYDEASTGNRIENSGSIVSHNQSAIFSNSLEFTLLNSATGIMTGNAVNAVEIVGTGSRIFNEGLMNSANSEGVDIQDSDALLKNSGLIETGSAAAAAVLWTNYGSPGNFDLVNTGEITGPGFAIAVIGDTANNLDLRNSGLISGDIQLNDGLHYIRSQNGTIDGTIYVTEGSARFFLGDEDNLVFDTGGGADRFDMGGGTDDVRYQNSLGNVHVDLVAGRGYSGDARGDRLIDVENLQGGFGDDLLLGDQGTNELDGYFGDDDLFGRGGDDYLNGNYDHDNLDGGDGNDTLLGGLGGDDLTGGADADVFVYVTTGDSTVTGIGRDRIMDFEQGVDLIDLSALGIESFIDQDAFTGGGTSEARFQSVGGGSKTLVQIDVDGDGNADMGIIINNASLNLTEDDFALGA